MAEPISEFSVRVTADDSKFIKELKKISKTLKNTFNTKNTTGELSKDFKALNNAISSLNAGMIAWEDATREVNKSTDNIIKKYKKLGKEKSLQKGFWAQYGLGETIKPLKEYLKKSKSLLKDYSKRGLTEEYSKENEKYLKYKRYKRSGLKYTPEDVATLDRAETYDGLVAKSRQYEEDVQMLAKLKASYMKDYGSGSLDALIGKRDSIQDRVDAIIEQQGKQRKNHKKITGQEDLEKYRKQLTDINEQIENRKAHEKEIADYEGRVASYTEKEKQSFKDMNDRYKETKENLEKGAQGNKGDNFWQKAWTKIKNSIFAFPRMLGRIFTRYLGYQLVKNLFGTIEEGMQNLYKWSVQNKKEWAEMFDKSKSMSVALGNAVAVFKTYLTAWITKAFTGIKTGLVRMFNWFSLGIAKLLAVFGGEKKAVQAREDIMVKWADNNEQTRQLIQGFDKLNIWKGNSNTLPENMFYEIDFAPQKAKEVGREMGENFVSYVLSADPTFIGGAGGSATEEEPSFWANIRDFFVGLWEGIKLGWGKVKEWFNGILQKIKTWWNGVTDTDEGDNGEIITRQVEPGFKHALKEWFSNTWNSIKEWFVGDENKGTQGIWQDKIKPFLEGIWNRFSAWMENTFVPLIAKIWENSGIKKAIDTEKDTLGDIGYSIANVLPWNWWKIQNGERPLVRPNAKGGVYTTPALGLVGEASTRNNPELITPQSLLDERLQANNRDLLGAINGMTNNIIAAVNGINMEVKIGDEVIAKSAARGNNAYYKMMGRPLIR